MSSKRVAFLAKTSGNLSTTIRNDKYDNINLNHYHKSEDIKLLQSKVSHFSKTTQNGYAYNYDVVSTKTHIPKSHSSWKNQEMKNEYKLQNDKNNGDCNKSTLSLHISAYENEVKNDAFAGKTLKNIPSSAKSQILLYFPRQQNEELMNPEIMRFKASQKLLNFNAIGRNDSFKMASKKLLQLRQLFCHASYLKPSSSPVCATSFRAFSTSPALFSVPSPLRSIQKVMEDSPLSKNLPKKETLLTIDWISQGLTPQFMKTRLQPIFEKMHSELDFVDEVFGYQVKGISQLGIHITKVRAYFRWKSPYNKTTHKGSYLFEDDNRIVLLWGLETMDSSIWTYFPSFITGKKTSMRYLEGALHFTVSPEGKITKIVNRKVTERDIKLAKEFGDLKNSENERFDKEDRKAAETEIKTKVERRDGMLKTQPYFYQPIKPCSPTFVATNLIQCRQFSSASENNMPEMYHLEHVQKRLEHTIPFMFQQRLDFTFYHRDVFYDNQILNIQDHGLDSYMKHLGRISVAGQLAMPYIKMAPLSINLVREDGSVRLRWRVAYLSWLDSLNFKNFKAEYREKNAQWYDGNATFYVGADGLVYKVIIQKLTPDDSFTQKSTKKLVEKIGILPQNTANFVAANSKEKETKDV